MSAEQAPSGPLPFLLKRHLFLTSSLEPVAEIVADVLVGRSYFVLEGARKFIRRPDLATDMTEVYIELPDLAHFVGTGAVVKWFDE